MGSIFSKCPGSKSSGSYSPIPLDPTPVEIPKGCRVNILKQDPTVHHIGHRMVWVPADYEPGPVTGEIVLKGTQSITVPPSDAEENDYLYELDKSPLEFDMVNTFTTVQQVLIMYRRALKRLDNTKELGWQWEEGPIKVVPRFLEGKNAFYARDWKSLCFYYFKDPKDSSGTIYTCRSYDIVSHETGHAILDALKPEWLADKKPQTGGLHESFGDLTAIFSMLSQLDMCEAVIALSKGDLRNHSFLPVIAEQFGSSLEIGIGLRNADNDLTLDDVTDEVHNLSRVFTGAVYDILADMYEISRNIEIHDPAETLYRVGKELAGIVLVAILNSPSTSASFADVGKEMMKATKESAFKNIMQKEFDKRKVFDSKATANVVEAKITVDLLKNCCRTMILPHDDDERMTLTKVINKDWKMLVEDTEKTPSKEELKTEDEDDKKAATILETKDVKYGDSEGSKHSSKEDLKTEELVATRELVATKKIVTTKKTVTTKDGDATEEIVTTTKTVVTKDGDATEEIFTTKELITTNDDGEKEEILTTNTIVATIVATDDADATKEADAAKDSDSAGSSKHSSKEDLKTEEIDATKDADKTKDAEDTEDADDSKDSGKDSDKKGLLD